MHEAHNEIASPLRRVYFRVGGLLADIHISAMQWVLREDIR
jgi:hypothetical protein